MFLKNGGWRGCGENVSIERDTEIAGQRVQVCCYTQQRGERGDRRSRAYYELRTQDAVVALPARVRSLAAAMEWARELYWNGDDIGRRGRIA